MIIAIIKENMTGPIRKIMAEIAIIDIIGYLPIILNFFIVCKFSYFTFKT